MTALVDFLRSVIGRGPRIRERVRVHRARGEVVHYRPRHLLDVEGVSVPAYVDALGRLVPGVRWVPGASGVVGAADQIPDPRDVEVVSRETIWNVKTTVGIDFTFAQTYSTSPGANGLNYVALSNDSLTETSGSTTLSNEITTNGLARAQGTYAHTTAASTATIAKTFTATGAQSAQKAALFSASSSGTMHHALSFTQRSLQTNDTLSITFTITLT